MQGDAATIAALFAVDPVGLGGVALRSPACENRDQWLALLKNLLPAQTPLRRVPLNINDTALLGGLDLGATLQAGKPIALRGLLAQADGGVLVLAMAERMSLSAAARFGSVLDTGMVALQRDGLDTSAKANIGLVALDEGSSDDEQMPAGLADRLAFRLLMNAHEENEEGPEWTAEEVLSARQRLSHVKIDDEAVQALCAAALALGIDSLRASVFAVRVARVAAALAGSPSVEEEHIGVAARLVLAPRATRLPPPTAQEDQTEETPEATENSETPPPEPEPPSDKSDTENQDQNDKKDDTKDDPEDASNEENNLPDNLPDNLVELVLEAAQAAMPAGLLASLKIGQLQRAKTPTSGSAGALQKNALRGRPFGARKGEPRAGQRINVLETLRAAAPWQKIRQRQQATAEGQRQRIVVRKEDFHVTRFRQSGQTTTVFVVDASGSSALNRLAEAKGAVELLLADCYVRRDSVAVLAFRGQTAELILPPTRSLARAKRSLAGLPGGGGTPLAHAIEASMLLAEQLRKKGETPIVVLLTDGKGNIARDGRPGRAQAATDALTAATEMRLKGFSTLLVDTSPQAQEAAQNLAQAMGAQYLALPYAGANTLNQAVRAVAGRA
ncbi:magnesium chelatase subunit D [Limnohabitans sp. MMS-10A-178]|uniref:magnesium chelatase subunit D n=1 Tax=Limnohabitans sp. MMS-10A-178 TaxID=1835767 RepID=UPI000D3C6D6E|nr:magnesium chelatase subunit D [Limnohabitans sp. MMS-10A-178]PUE16916.1 magnesium chelatase ATPase subunit D [Limnohabitans sp. MMS-10A-178]